MAKKKKKFAPREKFARGYVEEMAATLDPRKKYLEAQQAALRSPESVAAEITNLYSPVVKAAENVGQDVARVGESGLAALSGLAQSLPSVDTGSLADMYRAGGRAGAGAAAVGAALGSSAKAQLAQSIMAGQQQLSEEKSMLGERQLETMEEQAKIRSDWMPIAAQRQQMAASDLQNKRLLEELRMLPAARRAAILQNKLLSGQITAQDLENQSMQMQLKQLGLSSGSKRSSGSAGPSGSRRPSGTRPSSSGGQRPRPGSAPGSSTPIT